MGGTRKGAFQVSTSADDPALQEHAPVYDLNAMIRRSEVLALVAQSARCLPDTKLEIRLELLVPSRHAGGLVRKGPVFCGWVVIGKQLLGAPALCGADCALAGREAAAAREVSRATWRLIGLSRRGRSGQTPVLAQTSERDKRGGRLLRPLRRARSRTGAMFGETPNCVGDVTGQGRPAGLVRRATLKP